MLDDREYDQSRSALGTNVRRAASGKIASPLASGCAIEQTHTHQSSSYVRSGFWGCPPPGVRSLAFGVPFPVPHCGVWRWRAGPLGVKRISGFLAAFAIG